MKYFPINLDIAGRRCTVVGGGNVAERKIFALLECQAAITVISPELSDKLADMATEKIIAWQQREYRQGDLAGSFLVIAATDNSTTQQLVFDEANKNGQLVNVADVPELCNFILPATVKRNDLAISISTAGKSPALARKLRRKLESSFGDEYGILVDVLGVIRGEVLRHNRSHEENKIVFSQLLHEDFADWIRESNWIMIEEHLLNILGETLDSGLLLEIKRMVSRAET